MLATTTMRTNRLIARVVEGEARRPAIRLGLAAEEGPPEAPDPSRESMPEHQHEAEGSGNRRCEREQKVGADIQKSPGLDVRCWTIMEQQYGEAENRDDAHG